jgi:hypothetical protein
MFMQANFVRFAVFECGLKATNNRETSVSPANSSQRFSFHSYWLAVACARQNSYFWRTVKVELLQTIELLRFLLHNSPVYDGCTHTIADNKKAISR